jgi:hypothetical protein
LTTLGLPAAQVMAEVRRLNESCQPPVSNDELERLVARVLPGIKLGDGALVQALGLDEGVASLDGERRDGGGHGTDGRVVGDVVGLDLQRSEHVAQDKEINVRGRGHGPQNPARALGPAGKARRIAFGIGMCALFAAAAFFCAARFETAWRADAAASIARSATTWVWAGATAACALFASIWGLLAIFAASRPADPAGRGAPR